MQFLNERCKLNALSQVQKIRISAIREIRSITKASTPGEQIPFLYLRQVSWKKVWSHAQCVLSRGGSRVLVQGVRPKGGCVHGTHYSKRKGDLPIDSRKCAGNFSLENRVWFRDPR